MVCPTETDKKQYGKMNKTRLILMTAALTGAVLAGCSGDEEPVANVPDTAGVPIRITAHVNGRAVTRTGYEEGEEPDAIVLKIRQANESYSWTDVLLEKVADKWMPTNLPDGKQLLWCGTVSNATVRAFVYGSGERPTAKNNSDTLDEPQYIFQAVDQNTPEGVTSAELLHCYKENVNPEEDGILNLDFDHVLSKLVINYTYGTELDGSYRQLTSCTIGEVANVKWCDFDGAQLTFTDATARPVTVNACVNEEAQTVECILLPQIFTTRPTATFTVNIGGEERIFACEVQTDELESNACYTMDVKIGRDKVEATNMKTIKKQRNDD